MTTYLTREALDRAQVELERHLGTGFDGRCRACGEPEPCPGRRAAYATFARYGVLPRRRESAREARRGTVLGGRSVGT